MYEDYTVTVLFLSEILEDSIKPYCVGFSPSTNVHTNVLLCDCLVV